MKPPGAINGSRSLLIVDDEPSVTLTLKLIFEREGYSVVAAYSCAEALMLFANGHRYDAVITDLNMERDDIGLEVVRSAQTLDPRPVIVICTGYANVENATQALELRVDYLATKPVDLEELIGALRRLISRRAAARGSK
ncbi:MAG TPA: response regulator [Terriglobales bacterium]|nr:response regulator [Terriglobales bacterium]